MISIEEFTAKLEEEFEDVESGTLKPTTHYRDIPQFSSMYALIIIAFIDNQFDVLLRGEELKNAQTIQDLYNMVQQHLA
jgi:acyl carrier protein